MNNFTINIKELIIYAIIGIRDIERINKQKILINLNLIYNKKENNFIDYEEITKRMKKIIIDNKFLLLEDAIDFILNDIISRYKNTIGSITLSISKPDILQDCVVSCSKTKVLNADIR